MLNMRLAYTKRMMFVAKSWLAMRRYKFQLFHISFKLPVESILEWSHLENKSVSLDY